MSIYNTNLYNDILYNADKEEFAALAKSVISAHTGPHIQAVVGGDGLSFISDFVITQGDLTDPPSSFNFPDLSARLKAVQTSIANLSAFIHGVAFQDLSAAIYPVAALPDLPAKATALITTDLAAIVVGILAEVDLPAILQSTELKNLSALIQSILAPNIGGFISAHSPANLGAIIWAPENLGAIINAFQFNSLPATIRGVIFNDLNAKMTGIAAPDLGAFVRSLQSATADLGSAISLVSSVPDLGATITAAYPHLPAYANAVGGYLNLQGIIKPIGQSQADLVGIINSYAFNDLEATAHALSAQILSAYIKGFPYGEIIKDLFASLIPVRVSDLGASITALLGVNNLGAFISSNIEIADLAAVVTVDEIFMTSVLNIITLASANLTAVVGSPNCAGGSAFLALAASSIAQQAHDLGARIEAFMENNLGAIVNSGLTFRAFDTIDINFNRFNPRPKKIRFTDTIDISYSPFRGATLGASITAVPRNADLNAIITATFPLLRVSPFIESITAIDLNSNPLDITEIKAQLEGQLTEFLYVNGINQAFIKDPSEQWRINLRSFKELAEDIFGNAGVSRICRTGSLIGFATLDEAIRFCINSVLGLNDVQNLGASIAASGQLSSLGATIAAINVFSDFNAYCNSVFESSLSATITGLP